MACATGVDGVVAYNDDVAAIVVGAASRLGIPVPDDLSVVGHDDTPLSHACSSPPSPRSTSTTRASVVTSQRSRSALRSGHRTRAPTTSPASPS